MSEDLRSRVEQDQARKEEAFKATKVLLRNENSLEPIRKGLERYCGEGSSQIRIEMSGIEPFVKEETDASFFKQNTTIPFKIWGMITEQMKHNPDLTTTQFDDQEFLEKYLEELPENLYEAYVRSGSVATY